MKKVVSSLLVLGISVFAFAGEPLLVNVPTGNVKSYIKTDYTIASKFGEYFRTPSAKYQHVFNEYGQEIENSSLTTDGKVLDKITYSYDSKGNITTQTGLDDAGNVMWKIVNTYDKKGLKTEEAEYDAKDYLSSKSIFKYTGTNCTEETLYNGNGKIIWKNIYEYDENNNCKTLYSYYSNGELESKKTFKYNDKNAVQEIFYYDDEGSLEKKELYRYDAKDVLTEIATYTPQNKLYLRMFFKYDAKGNVVKITTYSIAQKFGSTVNELAGMSDYTYQY